MLHNNWATTGAGVFDRDAFAVFGQVRFRHQREQSVAVDDAVAGEFPGRRVHGFFDTVDRTGPDRGPDFFVVAAAGVAVVGVELGVGVDLVSDALGGQRQADLFGCGLVPDRPVCLDDFEELFALLRGHALTDITNDT